MCSSSGLFLGARSPCERTSCRSRVFSRWPLAPCPALRGAPAPPDACEWGETLAPPPDTRMADRAPAPVGQGGCRHSRRCAATTAASTLPCASTAAGSSDMTPRRRAPCSLAPSLQQRTRDHAAWSQPQKTCVRETPVRLAVAPQIIPRVSTRLDVRFTPCACARRRRARVHLFINLHPF